MNIEDIKIGETYYVRVKVLNKSRAHIGCCTVDKEGNSLVEFMTGEKPAFVPIPPTVPTGGMLHQSDDDRLNGACRKETWKTELGRMDYINKRCNNCKHFHFGNLTNSWCSYHNEDVCTIGKPCLCWELRKEKNHD